jgi:hypothetical protein
MGRAPAEDPESRTAAEEHGTGRAQSGFTVAQMVAEYRALRASVIRLWTKSEGALATEDIEDLIRFNEAIDQSLAESVLRFNQDLEQSKETFLAILGHDLRLPIGAIYTSAAFMLETGELEEPYRTLIARIAGSARRSVGMVGDLLDFTRSRLGGGIPIVRADVNLAKVLRDVVDEISAANPERPIRGRHARCAARLLGRGAPRPGARQPGRQRGAARRARDAGDHSPRGGARARRDRGAQPRRRHLVGAARRHLQSDEGAALAARGVGPRDVGEPRARPLHRRADRHRARRLHRGVVVGVRWHDVHRPPATPGEVAAGVGRGLRRLTASGAARRAMARGLGAPRARRS